MPIKSRHKGNTYERSLVHKYKAIGFNECVTSRAESRNQDAKGIDLCNTGPFAIQAKCYAKFASSQILKTLDAMDCPESIRICHVKISKKGGNPKDPSRGSFVAIPEDERMILAEYLLTKCNFSYEPTS